MESSGASPSPCGLGVDSRVNCTWVSQPSTIQEKSGKNGYMLVKIIPRTTSNLDGSMTGHSAISIPRPENLRNTKNGLELEKRADCHNRAGSPGKPRTGTKKPAVFLILYLLIYKYEPQVFFGLNWELYTCCCLSAQSTWSQKKPRSSCHSGNSPNAKPAGDHLNFPHPKDDWGCILLRVIVSSWLG